MTATATLPQQAPPAPTRWIVSRRYDLVWFFGGALASLAALGLYFGLGVSIVLVWWAWLLGFDGPHMAAAFTRTYLDRREWRARPGLLARSLLTFAVGPAFLAAGALTGSAAPFLAFLGGAAFYGYYHVVRQHYGFLALYKAKNGDFARLDFHLDKWALYVGCWAPYFYLLVTHPKARALMRLPVEAPPALGAALFAVWALALLAFLARTAGLGRAANRPKAAYVVLVLALYGLIYFLVGRYEPVYARSSGPDQDFLLLSVLVTIFHNIQYIALVRFHNSNRYAAPAGDFGPAAWVNRSHARFLVACGAFSIVYLLFACWTGVFPGCRIFLEARVGPFNANEIGLCLWWGLAVNHYYLDQKIWRIRGDADLKRNLGLA